MWDYCGYNFVIGVKTTPLVTSSLLDCPFHYPLLTCHKTLEPNALQSQGYVSQVSSEVDLSINGLPPPLPPLQNLGSRVPGRGTHMVNCAATLAKPIMRRDPPNFLNSYISVRSCHYSGLNYLVQMVRFCCYTLHIFSFKDRASCQQLVCSSEHINKISSSTTGY